MRNLIKGFVTFSIISVGFLGGFTADIWQAAPHAPRAALWHLQVVPPQLLTRVLQPASAHAATDDDTTLLPTDAYLSAIETIQRDYYVPTEKSGSTGKKNDTRLSTKRLTYAAIDGMLATLNDRYTEFWTPEEYHANMEETRGNFVGIGAKLDITKDKKVVIIEPLENSPAAKAGVLPGDIITAIGNRVVFGQDLQRVIDQIRGKEGSTVTLTIQRKGAPKPLIFNLTRAIVRSQIVESRMEDDTNKIGYIRLEMFTEQANQQFGMALSKLEKQGMRALIFDMRDNPGGLLNIAQDLASRFLDKGAVVWVREKSGRLSSLDVESDQHHGRLSSGAYPVIVLVNGNSASAAEIVSGAIQDGEAGQLLGTTTFGKGLVQTIIPLNDDSAVKITTQHYFTRNKHDINKRRDAQGNPINGTGGIKPDYVVEFTEKDLLTRREAIRNDPGNRELADKLDPQLNRAMEILRQKLAVRSAKL